MDNSGSESCKSGGHVAPGSSPVGSRGELNRLVLRLAQEFSAPVGLLDVVHGSWLARHGATDVAFPKVDPAVPRAVASAGLDPARVVVWNPGGGGEVWMFLPAPGPEGVVVAAVGFAAMKGNAPETPSRHDPDGTRWGPPCPDAALRAWGQVTVERLRAASASANANASLAGDTPASEPMATALVPVPARSEPLGSDGVVLARLSRRLRISDSPDRFQQLACNSLRAMLGVKAVAWVPCFQGEPVVVNGELGAMTTAAFRALLPSPQARCDPVHVENAPVNPPVPGPSRWIAVSADSQGNFGWLIAVDPLDGRLFGTSDTDRAQPVASMIATQHANARVYSDLRELLFGVIRALTAAIDAKDPYTSGHSERVARIAVRLAEELGMSPGQRSDLYLMGLLHDVGKIGVDDSVLKKSGPLTPDEYRQIQRHVEIGVQILADLKKLGHLLPGVRHHHESLDGTGYPGGLSGEAIPYEARILSVADCYDAMSSTRPYRRRLSASQIDEILRKGAGVQWDPKIIAALFSCRMDLEMIRQKGLGDSLQVAVTGTLRRG